MGTVLITGATGFLGFHIVEQALRSGYRIVATVRDGSKVEHFAEKPVQFVSVSLFDSDALRRILIEHNVQYVIHNAGLTKAKNHDSFYAVNAHSTRVLAEAVRSSGQDIKKFIFMSSMAAQGPASHPEEILHIDSPERPVTHYGRSKQMAEQILSEFEELNDIVFRPTAVYGPRERDILVLIKTVKSGFDLYLGRMPQRLSFVYASDLAKLVVGALASAHRKRKYIVTDGFDYDRYAFADILNEIFKKKALRLHLPQFFGFGMAVLNETVHRFKSSPPVFDRDKLNELMAPGWACDISKTVKDFNFTPEYDLNRGLHKTIEWYEDQGWL